MQHKIFIQTLLIFSFSSWGFLTLAVSQSQDTENKYSILTKMFQLVIKDMESHDERLKTLENKNAKTRKDQLQEAATDTSSTGNLPVTNQECKSGNGDIMTKEQVNNIEENLQQIKEYLTHMRKGIVAEKSLRAENTNTIGNFVDHYKESFDKLHQTLDHHGNNVENFFNDLDNDLKAFGDKINSHTDKVIHNFTKEHKEELKVLEELDKTGRENKEEMKTIVAALEKIKKDIEQIKPVMFYTLNKNIALGKNASESSSNAYGYRATVATDGITSGHWNDGSCTHTKAEMNPWWQVDLERPYFINRVVIKNRSDCCGERLHNLVISVRKELESSEEICGHFIGPSTNGATETIKCNHTVFGRYLKIQMNAKSLNPLTLCEVEVFAA